MAELTKNELLFIHRIKELRTYKQLKQGDFAEKLGVSESYYSRLENGKSKVIAEVFWGLYENYKISLEKLLSDNFKPDLEQDMESEADNHSLITQLEELKAKNNFLKKIILQQRKRENQ